MQEKHPKQSIWIDICHPPQAVFFTPLIREMEERGLRVFITVRKNFESVALLEKAGFEFRTIGRHWGKRMICKITGLVVRVIQLWIYMLPRHFDVGVSHGSPYLKVVCMLRRKPIVAIGDNEHSKGLLMNIADKILVPSVLPKDMLHAPKELVRHYPGLKEEIYIREATPHEGVLDGLSIDPARVIAVMRPPARHANYHNPESDILFEMIMDYLIRHDNLTTILLPRTQDDRERYQKVYGGNGQVMIPEKVLDGLDLLYCSDIALSGGGTMIREAAVMGVPAYSFFRGGKLAVDQFLVNQGRLIQIEKSEEIENIQIKKRERMNAVLDTGRGAKNFIVNEILACIS